MRKKQIKIGDRIELIETNDTWSNLTKGSKGTITKIDESQDLIWVNWDCGEKLALIDGVDTFNIIRKK